jgi:hypothetical protein
MSYDYDMNAWSLLISENAVSAPAPCDPTTSPTFTPSSSPTKIGETNPPTFSLSPTIKPTFAPSRITSAPSLSPTNTASPTRIVTNLPTSAPTVEGDTNVPTAIPTSSPTEVGETNHPSIMPTAGPTASGQTNCPTHVPSAAPSKIGATNEPTVCPTSHPTEVGATNAPSRSSDDGSYRPLISDFSCLSEGDGIQVSYAISGAGIFYCGAFENDNIPRVVSLWSVASEAESWAWTSHDSSSHNNVLNVGPVRRTVVYSVRCIADIYPYADRFTNISAPYVARCNTSALPGATLHSEFATAVVGEVLGPLAVSVDDNFFHSNFSVFPRVYFRAADVDDYCQSTVLMSSLSLDDSLLAPSEFFYERTSVGLTKLLYIQPVDAGCLYVTLTDSEIDGRQAVILKNMSGPVIARIENGKDFFEAIAFRVYSSVNSIAVAPVVSAVFFSMDASELIVEYISDTDMGKSAGLNNVEFNCNLMFGFLGSSESVCRFTSPRRVVAVLNSDINSDIVNINDTVILVGGLVRAACMSKGPSCQEYPFQSSSSMRISGPEFRYDVSVSISGPASVSLCSDIELDISRSVGSGGREWSSISWKVFNQFNQRIAPSLEAHLNGLDWAYCMSGAGSCNVVDSRLFPVGVEITLILTLQNFVGLSALGSHTISWTNKSFPHSRIGRTRVVATGGDIVNFNIFKYNVDCSHLGLETASDALSVSWYLQDDRSYNVELGEYNALLLSSKLSTVPFGFLRRFGYYLDAVVEDSLNQSSMASSMMYVATGHVHAIITGGSRATVASDQTFLLDATSSYNENFETGGLVFEWTCVKIAPSLNETCDGFENLWKFSPQISLNAAIMTANSIYAFTVFVSDGVNGSTTSSLASIDVYITDVASPGISARISGGSVPIKSAFNIPVFFDASVLSSVAFSVTWFVDEPVNATLSVVSFPEGGIISFPLQELYSSFIPGRRHTFRLNVAPDVECVGKCESFVYEIPFSVNSGPRSGYLLGSPSAGSLLTDFSLTAVGWVDMDLPLAYTFFCYYPETPDVKSVISPRGEQNWLVSHLMSGDPNNDNALAVVVVVSDALGYETSSSPLIITVLHDAAALHSLQSELNFVLRSDDLSTVFMIISILKNEIDPDFEEASFNCSEPDNISACISIASSVTFATEQLSVLYALDVDTSAQIVQYFSTAADFYINYISYAALSDVVASEGISALFRISETLNTVCQTGQCTQTTMEWLSSTVDKLVGLYDNFGEFGDGRRRLLLDEDVFAKAVNTVSNANRVIIEIAGSLLWHTVSMGTEYDLTLSNYDIHLEKGWPLLFNLPELRGNLLLDSELFDGDAASYGFHTVLVRLEEVPAANCINIGLPCTITSSSMHSTVYINTKTDDLDSHSSQGFLLSTLADPSDLLTSNSPNVVQSTCNANERVELHCSAEDTYGYSYSENITCPDLINDNSNISLQCPVFDVVALCAENGVESSSCIASAVTSSSMMCLCPLVLGSATSQVIPSVSISGYSTLSSSTRINAIFGTAITSSAEAIIPSSGESGGSQALSLNNVLSPNMMLFLIPLQILCCCCIILCCIFFAVRRKKEEKSESDEDEAFDEIELFDDEDSIFDDGSGDEFSDDFDDDNDIFMDGIEELDEEEDEIVATSPSVVSAPEKIARGSILDLGQSDESLGTAQETGERERKLDRWFDIVFEDGSNDYDHDAAAEGNNGSSLLNPVDSFDSVLSSHSDSNDFEDDVSGEYSY